MDGFVAENTGRPKVARRNQRQQGARQREADEITCELVREFLNGRVRFAGPLQGLRHPAKDGPAAETLHTDVYGARPIHRPRAISGAMISISRTGEGSSAQKCDVCTEPVLGS